MFLDIFVKKANNLIFEYPEALSYLKERKIEEEEIRKFFIGYAKAMRVNEDSEDFKDFLEETNNFKKLYSKIIFPLHNLLGKVVGLSLRSIDKKEYFLYFSSEAKKIGTFFGIVQALPYIKKTNRVFVHEGAINAISFSIVFPESISSLTSFLSEPQYELLTFLCDKIYLVFDRDRSGYLGVKKIISKYGGSKIEPLFFDNGDANDYLKFFGKEKFKEWMKKKYSYLFDRRELCLG